MDRYYLLSKDIGDGPYLLGELVRLDKGEYQFKYMINRDSFPEWFMKIPGMSDINKVYSSDEVKELIIHRVTPKKGTYFSELLMEKNNVSVYDEWDLLESQMVVHNRLRADKYPLGDSHENFYFYPEIPRKVNRFD